MSDEREAVLFGGGLSPGLDGAAFDLLAGAALDAHEVMVVVLGEAVPVEGFALWALDDVDGADFREPLQRAVDGGEPDLLVAVEQCRVDVFGGAELVNVFQRVHDGLALAGHARAEFPDGVIRAWHSASQSSGRRQCGGADAKCLGDWLH